MRQSLPPDAVPASPGNTLGLICAFYSYKGGTGRSMALANVAALLAKRNAKVLIVDWDLEAPGIEKYFGESLSRQRERNIGVVDLLHGWAEGRNLDWRLGLLETRPFSDSTVLSILSAGRQSPDYVSRVQSLDWDKLGTEQRLGNYLERLREDWSREFDFVLIDSRTGITDMGGICTIQLPDVMVAFFTTNDQSLEGVIDVMHRARRNHEALPVDRRRLMMIPVPARDESRTEYELAEAWKLRFSERLGEFYSDWLPKDTRPIDVLNLLKIPYVPYWSFGERLPAVIEGTADPTKLGFSYDVLARLLFSRLDWGQVRLASVATPITENRGIRLAVDDLGVGLHRRHVTIDDEGIAEVRVELTDVRMDGEIFLANLLPGMIGEGDRYAEVTTDGAATGRLEVSQSRSESGALGFAIRTDSYEKYSRVVWRCFVSNAFALDALDAQLGEPPGQRALQLPGTDDAYLAPVTFSTDTLELSVQMPDGCDLSNVQPVAQAPRSQAWSEVLWKTDQIESSKALLIQRSPTRIELAVSSPKVGHRYGLTYRLKPSSRKWLDADALSFLQRTLRGCRESLNQSLSSSLVDSFDAAFADAFDTPEPPSWIAHLWSPDAGKLLPAFGRFPPAQWGSVFEYGAGIAGHAFRHRVATVWKAMDRIPRESTNERPRLLYRPSQVSGREFDWIIEFPLFMHARGPALGVIGLSGLAGGLRSPVELRAAALAESVMHNPGSSAKRRLNRLSQVTANCFWTTMAASDEFAGEVVRKWWSREARV